MNDHTKEPWKIVDRGEDGCVDIDATPDDIPGWQGDVSVALSIGKCNATRIIECVNACAGISNDQLQNINLISGNLSGRISEQRAYLDGVELEKAQLLHMLGASDLESAAREIALLHAAALQRNEMLSVLEFIQHGFESGHIKAAPYVDFDDPNAATLEIKHPSDLVDRLIAKTKGGAA